MKARRLGYSKITLTVPYLEDDESPPMSPSRMFLGAITLNNPNIPIHSSFMFDSSHIPMAKIIGSITIDKIHSMVDEIRFYITLPGKRTVVEPFEKAGYICIIVGNIHESKGLMCGSIAYDSKMSSLYVSPKRVIAAGTMLPAKSVDHFHGL
jgi:hypothetical protein